MLTAIDVPSKRRFDFLPITLQTVQDGKSLKRLARLINQDVRHAHFMIQNARIFGFVSSESGDHRLTTSGAEFLNASPPMRGFILCKALLASKIISALLELKGGLEEAASLTREEISDYLIENAVVSETDREPMQRVTTNRRASSVRQWLSWLVTNLPCIPDEHDKNNESDFQETLE